MTTQLQLINVVVVLIVIIVIIIINYYYRYALHNNVSVNDGLHI